MVKRGLVNIYGGSLQCPRFFVKVRRETDFFRNTGKFKDGQVYSLWVFFVFFSVLTSRRRWRLFPISNIDSNRNEHASWTFQDIKRNQKWTKICTFPLFPLKTTWGVQTFTLHLLHTTPDSEIGVCLQKWGVWKNCRRVGFFFSLIPITACNSSLLKPPARPPAPDID